jgi:Cytochrome c554 and c-prime
MREGGEKPARSTPLRPLVVALAMWIALPIAAFVGIRMVRASSPGPVVSVCLRLERSGLSARLVVRNSPEVELAWGHAATAGMDPGFPRSHSLAAGETLSWNYALGPSTLASGSGVSGGIVQLDLTRILPHVEPPPRSWEVDIVDPSGRPVLVPGHPSQAPGRARVLFEASPPSPILVGKLDDFSSLGFGRLLAPRPLVKEEVEFLTRVDRHLHEYFEVQLTDLPEGLCFLPPWDPRELHGLPATRHLRGPALLRGVPRWHEERLILGHDLFWRAFLSFPSADRLKPDHIWMAHGLAAVFGLSFAHRVQESDGPAPWRSLWADFVSEGPFNYILKKGPEGQTAAATRAWRTVVSPVALLYASDPHDPEHAWILRPDGFREAIAALLGAPTSRRAHAWLKTAEVLGSEYPDWFEEERRTTGTRAESVADLADLTLLVGDDTLGFLETCGCKVSQSGGLARRATTIKRAASDPQPAIVVDLGNRYAELEDPQDLPLTRPLAALVDRAMAVAAYDIMVPDPLDVVNLGWERIPEWISREGVSCNLHLRNSTDPSPYRIVERAGRRIALVGVSWRRPRMGRFHGDLLAAGQRLYSLSDPVDSVKSVVDKLRASSRPPDLILVVGSVPQSIIEDMVAEGVAAHGYITSDTSVLERLPGRRKRVRDEARSRVLDDRAELFANMDAYGMTRFDLKLTEAGIAAARIQVEMLDDSVPDDHETRNRLEAFYRDIGDESARALKPLFPRNGVDGGGYVGSQACAECHPTAYDSWAQHPHGRAFDTLLRVNRHFVPECVQCHVVGLGEAGFEHSWSAIPERFLGVGCEVCHGGGAEHAARPTSSNIRRSMELEACKRCHDEEHSTDFLADFPARLENIRHWTTAREER